MKLRRKTRLSDMPEWAAQLYLPVVFWKGTAMKHTTSLADFASMMQWLMIVH